MRSERSKLISLVILAIFVSFGSIAPLTVAHSQFRRPSSDRDIKISVTPNPVALGESVSVRISVAINGDEHIDPPSFEHPNFELVDQGVSRQITTTIVNGSYVPSQRNTYTYILYPRKAGEITIENIYLTVGGKKVYLSNQKVVVQNSGNAKQNRYAAQPQPFQNYSPNSQQDSDDTDDSGSYANNDSESSFQLNSDFTVRVKLNKSKVYVGEPVVVEYYLYDFDNLHKIDIKKWPTFDGFWKEDLEIPTRFNFEPARVGSRNVRRALLGRFSLYPLKPGKHRLDKLIVDGMYSTNMQRGRRNRPFDMFFGHRAIKKAGHASQEEAVQVLPLPESGKPDNFNGAVGNFSISLTTDKTSVKANEPISFVFKVAGEGNVHEIEEPAIKFPEAFDLYESKTKVQRLAPRGVRIALEKSKSFEMLVLPRKQGSYKIASIDWPYFDPDSKSYKVLTTEPIEIEVGPPKAGEQNDDSVVIATADPMATNLLQPKAELRFLKSVDAVLTKPRLSYAQLLEKISFGLFSVNFMLLGLIFWRKRESFIDFSSLKNSKAVRMRKAIRMADSACGNKANIDYHLAQTAVRELIFAILEEKDTNLTKDEIAELWLSRDLPGEFLEKAMQALDLCDSARFAAKQTANSGSNPPIQKLVHNLVKEAKNL